MRDLDALLEGVVNRDIVERSSAALSHATDVANVFVPTQAYVRTWEVLKKHHFAVLEGPPEMGKSAISWMIALAQLAAGWEANVCDGPEDFFRSLRPDVSQIFVADDAFGRTEYDPSRGAKWEAQLHRVFSRLGDAHWLVWTSRKHILERARKHMDLQGAAHGFPKPGEVLVDASELTTREKALVLYRHAKHGITSSELKRFIQGHALQIVNHNAFTPERVRRLISEVVPTLPLGGSGEMSTEALSTRVAEEIRNPTDRMRKCFHALPLSHKWMLLSLLESGHYATLEGVASTYSRQYADVAIQPSEIIDELKEAFIVVRGTTERYVEWIHPSYRDLVIEQLRDGGSLRSEFLNRMDLEGIKLVLSRAGDISRKPRLQLIATARDREALQHRALQIATVSGVERCTVLLTVLVAALDGAAGQERSELLETLKAVCRIVREKWDSGQVELDASALGAFAAASEQTCPMEPMPRLDATWQATLNLLSWDLKDSGSNFLFDPSALDKFLSLIETVRGSEPRFLHSIGFPKSFAADFAAVLTKVDQELESDRMYSEEDEREAYESEADASFELARLLERMQQLATGVPEIENAVKRRVTALTIHANTCRQKWVELGGPAVDNAETLAEFSDSGQPGTSFDVTALFSDL